MGPVDPEGIAERSERNGGVTVTDVLMEAPGPTPLRVYLVIFAKEGPGHILDLEDGTEVSFGRTVGATIVIDDPRISRKHAIIRREKGDVFVRDLQSRNGTKVRNEVLRNEEKLVTAGDTIYIGPAEIVVAAVTRGEAHPRTTPTRPSAPAGRKR